jgi:hypothetical protein
MTYKHKANEEDEDGFKEKSPSLNDICKKYGNSPYPGEKEEFEELKQFIEQPFPKKDIEISII